MRPVVRLFVACWNGVPGTSALLYQIKDIRTLVFPRPGLSYPVRHGEFCFIVHLTGARGSYDLAVWQRVGFGHSNFVVWRSRPVTIDLGNDPLTVRFVPIRVSNLVFPAPGQYEFVLMCNGEELEPAIFLEART